MQLLKIILIIILAYYLLKIIMRYLLPVMAKYFVKKTFENYQNQAARSPGRKGEVKLEYPEKKMGRNKENLGEYVDYEEINEQ
ncbi:MAG: DUF4834 domain-containing protein [Bacteroidetes bacterium]|nr:DUF4834 domain-containing protein [Bacteroidota bacterium]